MRRQLFTSLAAATAFAASVLITSGPAASAEPAPPPVPSTSSTGVTTNSNPLEAVKVDDPNLKIVATLHGVGKQVYDCKSDGTGFAFREPVAGLFTSRGVPAAIHGKGPFWANFDGSHVGGTVSKSVTPDPKSIPWLLLTATPDPSPAVQTGVFSNVAFIQRIDTRGGLAPTGTCTAPKTVAVDYTANYVFWAPGSR